MPGKRGRRPTKERVPPTNEHVKRLVENIRARFEERGDRCCAEMPDKPAALFEFLVDHYERPTHTVTREQARLDMRDALVLQQYCATTMRWRLYQAGRAAGLFWAEFNDDDGPIDEHGRRTGYWTNNKQTHQAAFATLDRLLGGGRPASQSPSERRMGTRRAHALNDDVTEQLLGVSLTLLSPTVRIAVSTALAGTLESESLAEDWEELAVNARPPEGIEISRTWLAVRLRCLLTTVLGAELELRSDGLTPDEIASRYGAEAHTALAAARTIVASYAESVD